jgi:hypothetical protein
MNNKLTESQARAEEAFAFYVSLEPKERKYTPVAERFDVSLATVKLWGAKGKWRRRAADRDVRVVRRAMDKAETAEADTRATYLKVVELALMKLARGIADGEVKGTFSDLDRLVRLKVFLEEPDVVQGGPQQVIVNIVRGEANAMATSPAPGPGEDHVEP